MPGALGYRILQSAAVSHQTFRRSAEQNHRGHTAPHPVQSRPPAHGGISSEWLRTCCLYTPGDGRLTTIQGLSPEPQEPTVGLEKLPLGPDGWGGVRGRSAGCPHTSAVHSSPAVHIHLGRGGWGPQRHGPQRSPGPEAQHHVLSRTLGSWLRTHGRRPQLLDAAAREDADGLRRGAHSCLHPGKARTTHPVPSPPQHCAERAPST